MLDLSDTLHRLTNIPILVIYWDVSPWDFGRSVYDSMGRSAHNA